MNNCISGFSVRLKEERARLGLNQEEFGRLAGVGKVAQLNYEKGNRIPSIDYLFSLEASNSGADIGYLMSGIRNAPLHANGGSLDHQLLTDALSVIASLGEGCAVNMSVKELSSMSATLYRMMANEDTGGMPEDEVFDLMMKAAGQLFSGWLIGKGMDVPGLDHPQEHPQSIR